MYFITFIASPKKTKKACGTFRGNILTASPILHIIDKVGVKDKSQKTKKT